MLLRKALDGRPDFIVVDGAKSRQAVIPAMPKAACATDRNAY